MRVLVVSSLFPPRERGGYELTCAAFVRYLREIGHDVRVLTSDHRPTRMSTQQEEWPEVHRVLSWRDWRNPLGRGETLRNDRRDVRLLRRHTSEFEPEAITLWGMNGLSRALLPALRSVQVPISGRISDGWLEKVLASHVQPRRVRWAKRAARTALGVPIDGTLGHVQRWVFSSRYMLESAVALGLEPTRAAVVHSGVDVDAYPRRSASAWRGRLLYLGRIDVHKGIDTAVRAVAELESTTLRIVGAGLPEAMDELSGVIAALRLDDRVEICPPVDQAGVVAELQRADAVLFPVRWPEPWGKVPLEAMAAGVPVIASGTGGSAEYLRHRENALVAPPDEPPKWIEAIRLVAGSDELRARLQRAGYETADRYSERRANQGLSRELLGIPVGECGEAGLTGRRSQDPGLPESRIPRS